MRTRTHLLAVAMTALGGLLRYAAAAGQLTSFWQVHASPPDHPTGSRPATGAGGCSEGIEKGLTWKPSWSRSVDQSVMSESLRRSCKRAPRHRDARR
jgi:hypothetical protein